MCGRRAGFCGRPFLVFAGAARAVSSWEGMLSMDFDNTDNGTVRISRDVIASVARFATLEINGVDSVASSVPGVRSFARARRSRPITVDITDGVVSVTINVIVKLDVKIPEISAAVQSNVKSAIQSMTGLAVSRVDIVVAGISLKKEDGGAQE